jgi:nucleoside-diphosphate-sugar epimerase
MKKALVCGAGGFIASHLVKRLKKDGYWVRGVDIKYPEYSATAADEFLLLDLRQEAGCRAALTLPLAYVQAGPSAPHAGPFDLVFQLAADMGGMGFIHSAECEIMRNSALINIQMTHAASEAGAKRYFFSSSACVYRDMRKDEDELTELQAYPALPDNEYGWEKLYAERMAMAYGRRSGMIIRLARFQNTFGPEGTWHGGREKAPAALCRKIAEAPDGGTIEVWGDGSAMRAYTYIDDLVDGIVRLMASDLEDGVNIGRPEYVSVDELVQTVAAASGKTIYMKHIAGPVGVKARNFTNARIRSTGWESKFSLRDGIARTYPWIEAQVKAAK